MNSVNAKEITAILGTTAKTLETYRVKGLPTLGTGRSTTYPVAECVDWLATYRVLEDRKQRLDSTTQMTQEEGKAAKIGLEVQLLALEVAQVRGDLVNVDDARKELERYLSVVRASLLSFPARFAPYAVMIPDEKTARLLLDEHISAMMTDIVTQTDSPPPEEMTVEDDSDEEEDQ